MKAFSKEWPGNDCLQTWATHAQTFDAYCSPHGMFVLARLRCTLLRLKIIFATLLGMFVIHTYQIISLFSLSYFSFEESELNLCTILWLLNVNIFATKSPRFVSKLKIDVSAISIIDTSCFKRCWWKSKILICSIKVCTVLSSSTSKY